MKDITKGQIITIHTLLHKHGIYEEKANIVSNASNGRTISCARLTYNEAANLINFLNAKNKITVKADPRCDKMIKYIIAMANEIGLVKMKTVIGEAGKLEKKKDYTDLHSWIAKYGHKHKELAHLKKHKHLNSYGYSELPTLVTQFEQVWKEKMKIS